MDTFTFKGRLYRVYICDDTLLQIVSRMGIEDMAIGHYVVIDERAGCIVITLYPSGTIQDAINETLDDMAHGAFKLHE